MFLKVNDDLVNLENVRSIEVVHTTHLAYQGGEAVERSHGVRFNFSDGSIKNYSISMEEVVDALTELGVML